MDSVKIQKEMACKMVINVLRKDKAEEGGCWLEAGEVAASNQRGPGSPH